MLKRENWLGLITTSMAAMTTGVMAGCMEVDEDAAEDVLSLAQGDVVCQSIDTNGAGAVLVGDVVNNALRTDLAGKAFSLPAFVQQGGDVAWCQEAGTIEVRDLYSDATTFYPVDCLGMATNPGGEVLVWRLPDGTRPEFEQYPSLDALIADEPSDLPLIEGDGFIGGMALTAFDVFRIGTHPAISGTQLVTTSRLLAVEDRVTLQGQDDIVAGISVRGDILYLLTAGQLGASDIQELVRYDRRTGVELSRVATAFDGGAQGLVCSLDLSGIASAGPVGPASPTTSR